jgi:hypothetical protein
MNKDMIKKLAEWIESLKDDAENDNPFDIAWFSETKNKPFSIIGGWMEGFSEDYSDLLCISESNPKYAMCIKIAVNEGPYAYTDFELMNMPVDPETKEVDDTCIALEYNDDSESLAQFLLMELERITKEYGDADDEE